MCFQSHLGYRLGSGKYSRGAIANPLQHREAKEDEEGALARWLEEAQDDHHRCRFNELFLGGLRMTDNADDDGEDDTIGGVRVLSEKSGMNKAYLIDRDKFCLCQLWRAQGLVC